MGSAALMYVSAHGSFPYATSETKAQDDFSAGLNLLRDEGFYEGPNPSCAHHPSSQAPFMGFLAPYAPEDVENPVPLAWDTIPHAEGRKAVLFSDGSVQNLSEGQFARTLIETATAITLALKRLENSEAPARSPSPPPAALELERD